MTRLQQHYHELALKISQDFRSIEGEMIGILEQIDSSKVYLELGFASVFDYCVHSLHLSESNAYSFTRIARKALFVPALKTEIQAGRLSISNAKLIVPLINLDNQSIWLERAVTLSKRELEKMILREHPSVPKKESVRLVSDDRVSLKIELSEELMKKLRRAQAVLSNQQRRVVSLEETFHATTDLFIHKKDPVAKAERAESRSPGATKSRKPQGGGIVSVQKRKPIPAHIKHEVIRRDGGRCAYTSPEGLRCQNPFFVELHHLRPISVGGANSVENLICLCSQHHGYWHEMHFPTHRESKKMGRDP